MKLEKNFADRIKNRFGPLILKLTKKPITTKAPLPPSAVQSREAAALLKLKTLDIVQTKKDNENKIILFPLRYKYYVVSNIQRTSNEVVNPDSISGKQPAHTPPHMVVKVEDIAAFMKDIHHIVETQKEITSAAMKIKDDLVAELRKQFQKKYNQKVEPLSSEMQYINFRIELIMNLYNKDSNENSRKQLYELFNSHSVGMREMFFDKIEAALILLNLPDEELNKFEVANPNDIVKLGGPINANWRVVGPDSNIKGNLLLENIDDCNPPIRCSKPKWHIARHNPEVFAARALPR